MKRFLIVAAYLLLSITANAQSLEISRLEMYYAQGHYTKVYKQSGKILDKPEYDDSSLPAFYRALSTFQLSGNKKWSKSRPHALNDAKEMYAKLLKTSDGQEVIDNHMEEVMALKQDLIMRAEDLKTEGRSADAEKIAVILSELFDYIPAVEEVKPAVPVKPVEPSKEFTFNATNRQEIVEYAKTQLGKPYVSAGTTPAGFDCSGFTSYIFKAYKIDLPRRSEDQFNSAVKVKENKVQKGDLVFFDNGNGVNHVGVIISEQGQSPVMIHASTSKGIIVTDIKSSEYWNKRVKGYGTFLN